MHRRIFRTLTVFAFATLTLPAVASAAQPDAAEVKAAVNRLERAELTYNRVELQRSIDTFSRWVEVDGERWEHHYHLARAYFPLIDLKEFAGDAEGAEEAGERGLEHVREAIRLHPDGYPDAYRLAGDFYGRLTGFKSILTRMSYGGSSNKHHKTALEQAPKSYLAVIGAGTDKLYAPAAFGGDTEGALELFRQASVLASASPLPHIWIARAHLKLGEKDKARTHLARALEIEPKSGLARLELDRLR
jgi:tetratricopeptide (TPR) repeat protein